jgi:hypothetical protein
LQVSRSGGCHGPPQILAHMLNQSKPGGRLYPSHYRVPPPPRILRPSYGPALWLLSNIFTNYNGKFQTRFLGQEISWPRAAWWCKGQCSKVSIIRSGRSRLLEFEKKRKYCWFNKDFFKKSRLGRLIETVYINKTVWSNFSEIVVVVS